MLETLPNSERAYFGLLQAKLTEILQFSRIGGLMVEQDFREYDYALHICNEVWQTEETQRRQRQQEENSLYVQQTHCSEENEELVELQEIAEHFPTDVEEDFGDFILHDTLEQVMKLSKKPLKKKFSHILGDEEYAFLVENFMQLMLQHTKVYYYEPTATNGELDLQHLVPSQQRLSVFVQLFAHYKTALHEILDADVFNSLTLALGLQQQVLNELEVHDKSYNYYKDANIAEVRNCAEVLSRIEKVVQAQLELYAEHATLQDILLIMARIRKLPANAALVRFNMGFQLLRQKVAQWNEVAHKANHLRDEEIVIAEHVQRWTRLELQCWRNCLQQTEQQMCNQAYRYWFFIYNLMQEYFQQGTLNKSLTDIKYTAQRFGAGELLDEACLEGAANKVSVAQILSILQQFMEAADYGDFEVRLRLLQAFELYLHNVKNYASSEYELTSLIAGLRNLYIYYAQFSAEIANERKNMRTPIEKKLKEFVKIESYNKDLSYFSMKNNVARVHRQLNKFLREYRKQLEQKITAVFQARNATIKDYQFHTDKGRELRYNTRIKYYMQPARVFIAPMKLRDLYAIKESEEQSSLLIQRVGKLFVNSRNVVKSTVQNAKYPQLVMSLDELFNAQLERCEHLRNLNVDRTRERPQQKVEAKHILQMKRKALVDLFKLLAQLGVSYKSGLLELGLRTEFTDFSLPPFCIKSMLPRSSKQCNLMQLAENIDTYFAKCVFKLRLFQNIMLSPLAELGAPNIDRMKGTAIDLFLLVQQQRLLFANSSKAMYDLSLNLHNMREIAGAFGHNKCLDNTSFAKSRHTFVKLKEAMGRIYFVFTQLQLVLNCAPSEHSSTAHVFSDATTLFLKQSTQYQALSELCKKVLNTSKETLDNMHVHDSEFLSADKLSVYVETCQKLVILIKEIKLMFSGQSEPLAVPLDELLQSIEKSLEQEPADLEAEVKFEEVEVALESVLHAVLLALQKLYKKYPEQEKENSPKNSPDKPKKGNTIEEEMQIEDIEEEHLRTKLLEELTSDWEILNLPHIVQQLGHILLSLKHANVCAEKEIYWRKTVSMLPLLEQYQLMADYFLFQQLGAHKVSVKLLSVLLTVFVELGTKGFCVPPDLMQDEESEKKGEQKEGEGFGLEDGTGEKDASDKLESEDQLDDAKRPEDRKDEGDKEEPDCKEEKGIEMSDDFDGKMQDVEKPENEEDDSGESEDEKDLNKEMGETEENAEKLDDQIWGDDEEQEEEEEDKDMEEEDGKGSKDEKDSHNDLNSKNDAAQEDGKNNEEKEGLDATEEPSNENKKKQQENDIDQMKDQEGDEEQINPYHNELEEPPEPEEMDLGEMNNNNDEEAEGDEQNADENPYDIDRMKENMVDVEDKEENENDEDCAKDNDENKQQDVDDSEDEAGTELKEDTNAGDEEIEPEKDEQGEPERQKRGELEKEEEESMQEDDKEMQESHEEKPEEHAQSNDKSSKEDNVQSVPETQNKSTADQVQSEQKEQNVEQEEKLDEQDTGEEKDGVGQAENEQQDAGHKGIAETKETIAREDSKNESKKEEKRKQGNTDEERSLGEAQNNKLRKLKTIDKLKQDKEKEQEEEVNNEKDEDMEAKEYQHVKEAKNSDKITLDNATEDQSKQIKHQEDEEKNVEEADIENTDEMTEDIPVEDNMSEDLEELKADKLEQKTDKSNKSEQSKERAEAQQEEQILVEGEYSLTMNVPREAQTTAHCSKQILLDNSQAEELSRQELLELQRQYQQQLATNQQRPEHADYESWQTVSQRMSQNARELCEQLRLILEPTKCTRLKGDYRTGRRINMKKIIPYIASQFRKDKIWLRRTKAAQRDYKITIAIDDSKSMHHNNSKTLTLEAIAMVSQALTLLESGRLSIVSFGQKPQIILNHTEQLDGAKLVNCLNFEQDKTKVAEMLDFIRTISTEEGLGGSDNALFENLLLILSDGRNIFSEGKTKVKNAVKLTRLQRIFLVYIIIDNPENKNSVLDIQTMEMLPDKRISIKSYLDDFPFPYYVIVRDLNQLPLVLSEAMRQWFELVNSEQ